MGKNLTIEFEEDDKYRIIPVHGVWGGVTPTGDVMADIYTERLTPPEELVLDVEKNVIREVERNGERRVRSVYSTLLLRPDIAYAVGKWLIQKAEDAGFVQPEEERH